MKNGLILRIVLVALAVLYMEGNRPSFASRSFSGNPQHLTITGSSLNITGTQLTIAAWVWPTTTSVQSIVGKWNSTHAQYILLIGSPTANKFDFSVGNGTTTTKDMPCTSAISPTSAWYHVAGTINGTAMNIYQGGNNCGSNNIGISLGASGLPTCIGAYEVTCNALYFTGRIAEVAIWDVALTPNEIKSLANCVPPPIVHGGTDLKGYYPLWGVDSPEQDYSGNLSSGTLSASAPTLANHVCGPGAGGK